MRKKTRSKALSRLLLATLLFTVFAAALWPTALTLLFQSALSRARASGLRIAWQDVSASYLSARAGQIEVWIPGPPVEVTVAGGRVTVPGPVLKIEVSDLTISVDPFSLLRLTPTVEARANLYGGSVVVELQNVFGQKVHGKFNLEGVSLDKHPQIRSLGITGGAVRVAATDLLFSTPTQALLAGNAKAQLKSLKLPSRPELALLLKGEPLALDSLSTTVTLANGSLSVTPLELASSLGEAKGRATIAIPSAEQKLRIDSNATISLSSSGSKTFGQWLPLISNGAIQAEDSTIEVTGVSAHCSDKTLELPFGCVRVVFTPKRDV